MLNRRLVFLFVLVFVMFSGNEAYSNVKPAENPMPEKLFIPAELLGIETVDKLPSANFDVDMPELSDFKMADNGRAKKAEPDLPASSYRLIRDQFFIWPVIGEISSGYGFRPRRIRGGINSAIHEGIDIPMPKGTPIMASRRGVVTRADTALRGYGKLVTIDHGNGVETRYAHCSEFAVKKGDVVNAGQVIAYVGNTGRSTSSHLHFEILINGLAYNPTRFLGDYTSAFVLRFSEY